MKCTNNDTENSVQIFIHFIYMHAYAYNDNKKMFLNVRKTSDEASLRYIHVTA